MMLYVYIINIFIYSGIRSVFGSVPVRFGYFGYKNTGTVRIFEDIGPVPVSGISVRFFGSGYFAQAYVYCCKRYPSLIRKD